MLTFIKTIDGIDISVNERGKFVANINGKDVEKTSLSAVEKQITSLRGAVILYDMRDYWAKAKRPIEILGYEGGRVRSKDGKLHGKYELELVYCSEKDLLEIDKIVEAQEKIDEKWANLKNRLLNVSSSNFDKVRDKILANQTPS